MIIVSSPLMKESVKQAVINTNGFDIEYLETRGIDLYFKANKCEDDAVKIIKTNLKNDDNFKGLIIKVRKEY